MENVVDCAGNPSPDNNEHFRTHFPKISGVKGLVAFLKISRVQLCGIQNMDDIKRDETKINKASK